ncbi:MAG: GrpB family protein [Phaeodactylibacter sp.]|uniref:GrpB family protein n=1 Tax=Phaeodactylibacter sp. TaxID=1940289 RepID=UPI0032EFA5F0
MAVRVTIEPYNVAWPAAFQEEQARLLACLSDWMPEVQHIGSTAVKGLGGKPIIDIMVGFEQEKSLNAAASLLVEHGYCYYPCFEEPPFRDRRFLALLQGYPSTVFESPDDFPDRVAYPPVFHLHLLRQGSPFWKRHLAFRDYLRRHPITRDAYYRMKVKLAKGVWESQNDYAKAKTAFIRRVERLAELEG